MSDKKQNRHKKALAVVLSPEEQAKILADRAAKEAEQKAERERIELFGKSVEGMSHRQLVSELRKAVKREYSGRPPQPKAGPNIAWASVMLIVLENTQTKENPFAKLSAYPR